MTQPGPCGPKSKGQVPSPGAKPPQLTCLTWSSLQAAGKEPCPQVIGTTLGLSVAVCKMVDWRVYKGPSIHPDEVLLEG